MWLNTLCAEKSINYSLPDKNTALTFTKVQGAVFSILSTLYMQILIARYIFLQTKLLLEPSKRQEGKGCLGSMAFPQRHYFAESPAPQ
jgi:hypothetical protein